MTRQSLTVTEQTRLLADIVATNGMPTQATLDALDPLTFPPGWRRLLACTAKLGQHTGHELLAMLTLVEQNTLVPMAPEDSRPPRKTSWTVAELLQADFPEPPWVVPELLPKGLTNTSGRPKRGKSIMSIQLAIARGSGGKFFGRTIEQGPALYLAYEDPPRRLKKRLIEMQARKDCLLTFELAWPPLPQGGYEALEERIRSDSLSLVIIDTITRALAGTRIDWNDVGQATNALAPLQEMSFEHDCGIHTNDHHRKPGIRGQDPVDDMMSSTGKAAIYDCIWGLYKTQGKRGATLRIRGRDQEDRDLAVQFDPVTLCWQCLGDERTVQADTVQAEVLDALKALDQAGPQDIALYLNRDKGNIFRVLTALIDKGLVTQEKPRSPYRLVTT